MKEGKKAELRVYLYHKYIEPTERPSTRGAGIEFELPIVNLRKEAVDFELIHRLSEAFMEAFSFEDPSRDEEGHIYNMTHKETGDVLSYDCSFNTIEFSFGLVTDLNKVYDRFVSYYSFIQEFLKKEDHTLTGMGINPYHQYNKNVPIKNGRYRMLFHYLSSYQDYEGQMDFHDLPNFGLFSCASQVQLDLEKETMIEVINTFNRLEPLKAILFANSPYEDYLCARDYFWKHSMHGLNPKNVDMYQRDLKNVEELLDYIAAESMYCLDRDGKYMNFPPIPLCEYMMRDEIQAEYFNTEKQTYEKISFRPELEDIKDLRSFKFEDVTFRGTVELRSVCEQPVSEIMSSAAFHTGLIEKMPELTKLLDDDCILYRSGKSPVELRELYVRKEMPELFDREKLSALILEVLELAEEGLRKRGKEEEKFLRPLYRRAELLLSPAREMLQGLEEGREIEYYINQYAELA
jgi:glutamate--cysteine ligase